LLEILYKYRIHITFVIFIDMFHPGNFPCEGMPIGKTFTKAKKEKRKIRIVQNYENRSKAQLFIYTPAGKLFDESLILTSC